jgi:transcriptional regulator with XRE-family HTH domain
MTIPLSANPAIVYRTIPCGYDLAVSIAKNLHDLRRAAKLNQTELANVVGVEQPAVSKWERGKSEPSASDLPKIATAFGCTVNDLLRGVDATYDSMITRAETAHAKKSYEVTSSDTGGVVQGSLHTHSEALSNATTANRSISQAEALRRVRLLKQLYDAADAVRAATDALGGDPDPTVPGQLPEHSKSDAHVPGRAKPRHRRAR